MEKSVRKEPRLNKRNSEQPNTSVENPYRITVQGTNFAFDMLVTENQAKEVVKQLTEIKAR